MTPKERVMWELSLSDTPNWQIALTIFGAWFFGFIANWSGDESNPNLLGLLPMLFGLYAGVGCLVALRIFTGWHEERYHVTGWSDWRCYASWLVGLAVFFTVYAMDWWLRSVVGWDERRKAACDSE